MLNRNVVIIYLLKCIVLHKFCETILIFLYLFIFNFKLMRKICSFIIFNQSYFLIDYEIIHDNCLLKIIAFYKFAYFAS